MSGTGHYRPTAGGSIQSRVGCRYLPVVSGRVKAKSKKQVDLLRVEMSSCPMDSLGSRGKKDYYLARNIHTFNSRIKQPHTLFYLSSQ